MAGYFSSQHKRSGGDSTSARLEKRRTMGAYKIPLKERKDGIRKADPLLGRQVSNVVKWGPLTGRKYEGGSKARLKALGKGVCKS